MNVEFHYYSIAFLAVKAGWPLDEAERLAYASQYVDHRDREWRLNVEGWPQRLLPTQNYSFWDRETVENVLAPFHFLPSGYADGLEPTSRQDGKKSSWDVRPNGPWAKSLLVSALRSQNIFRIGIALHTFADTWAHQNFTARNETWNRLTRDAGIPAPGHAQAGTNPDLWFATWEDPRLVVPTVVNRERFLEAAGKIYRYLCLFRRKDYADEGMVLEQLGNLVDQGRGKTNIEERVLDIILLLNLEPYDRTRWERDAVSFSVSGMPDWLEPWKQKGEALLGKAGLALPLEVTPRPGFETSDLAQWLRAAEVHRAEALALMTDSGLI